MTSDKACIWMVGQRAFTSMVEEGRCAACHNDYVVVALPQMDEDDNTHICEPLLGGCNQRFMKVGGGQ